MAGSGEETKHGEATWRCLAHLKTTHRGSTKPRGHPGHATGDSQDYSVIITAHGGGHEPTGRNGSRAPQGNGLPIRGPSEAGVSEPLELANGKRSEGETCANPKKTRTGQAGGGKRCCQRRLHDPVSSARDGLSSHKTYWPESCIQKPGPPCRGAELTCHPAPVVKEWAAERASAVCACQAAYLEGTTNQVQEGARKEVRARHL